ncbi:hypothetical protein LMG29739_05449 [Paraburkholderia solisilvae]|uniref:Uncharacterized protein n=1 Tax=Paraburkholderia solisilvae TaxID=624376 RepID=A0A6J5ETY2_9BURK|nr:hypothetical protein LMG29739_05449 [Paraburkholderia solisilvae]
MYTVPSSGNKHSLEKTTLTEISTGFTGIYAQQIMI